VIRTAKASAERQFGAPRGLGECNLSTVMGEAHVSRAIARFGDTLQELSSCVAECYPALLSK